MNAPGRARRENMPLFPFALLTITALFSMIGLVGVGWMSTAALEDLARTDHYPELQDHLREIMVYDEVLTMSARMAVATGDPAWVARYDAHDALLGFALDAARGLEPGFAESIDDTAAANDALVEMERAALAGVGAGLVGGPTPLDSTTYQVLKETYKRAMGDAISGVRDRWTRTVAQQQRLSATARAATIVVGLLLAVIWGLSVRALDGWRQATMVARRNTEGINARLEDAVLAGRLGVFALPDRHGAGELSPRGCEILGVAPAAPFTEAAFVAQVDPADRAALIGALWETWQPHLDEAKMIELRVRLADGATRWVRAAWRVDARGGAAATLHGVVQDIDEEKRLAERLTDRAVAHGRLADERLAHMQALVRDLMRAELHERQRLARILHDEVQQSLLAARMHAATWGEGAEGAAAPGERARKIVELLDESYAATRNLTARLRPAPVEELGFSGALEALVARVEGRFGLSVELTMPAALPPLAPDVAQFAHAVVQELLFNTVRHAGVESAEVAVEVVGDRLRVTVSDRGDGFDMSALNRTRQDGGFGLPGLQRQATAFDGRLTIDSAPGAGSRMVLELPVGERRPTSRPIPIVPLPEGAGLRVLIVEDSEPMRQQLAVLIGRLAGVEVVGQAATTPEGVALAVERRPDVVVMDYTFDWGPHGDDGTRRIKAELPGVFVIGFTASDRAGDIAAMVAAGADLIVRKDQIDALMEALRSRTVTRS